MRKNIIRYMLLIIGMILALPLCQCNVWAEETEYKIVINRTKNHLTIFRKDESGKFTQPIQKMLCSTAEDIASTPLGAFELSTKKEWRENKDKTFSQYAYKLTDRVWFVGSVYKSNSAGDMIVSSYNKLGNVGAASGDCIVLSVADAKWIYDNCAEGTQVIIQMKDDEKDTLEPASPLRIPENHQNAKWDPTDPNSRNPWLNEKPQINGVSDKEYNVGEEVNLMSGISATDICGNDITSKVIITGGGDFSQPGEYLVSYYVADVTGASVNVDAKIKIVKENAEKSTNANLGSRPGTTAPTRGGILEEEEEHGFGTVLGIVAAAFVISVMITRWASK